MFSGAFSLIFWIKSYYSNSASQFMNGLLKSNELISRDESLHMEFGILLFNRLNKDMPKYKIMEIVLECVSLSKMFNKEILLSKEIGLNIDMLNLYTEYMADRILMSICNEKFFKVENPFNFMSVEHRYRAEQRYTNLGYRNRFRYRLSAKVPILKSKEKEYFLLGWNELFFTNNEPFFERNRLFLGGGFDINKNLAIQTGYIYQFDYKINDETGRDFLNIVLLYSFDFKGEKETNLD
jgi:hypothetical protein